MPTDTKEEPKYHPCNVCGVDAVACLSPDMDVKGLCFCEEHQRKVSTVYMLLMSGDDAQVEILMKDWKHK